jgi:2-oxoglutarate ferredoxin oxidoreductase subunit alpha
VFLEGHPESGVAVVQVEDEIAAVTMATGAALTGTRASTSTSGPGLNLMVEGLGWAGICEVPLVIFNYQRGGPSTGLPTRTEQGDARFALHAGHGEFPRLLLAPGDIDEMFYDTIDAFNWAEKYQTLVIVLPDKQLAGNSFTTKPFDTSKVRIDRGKLLTEEQLASRSKDGLFLRFQNSDDGISERSVLGQKGGIHWLTGDEHTTAGHITEDPQIRDTMMEKRARKLELAAREIPGDRKAKLHGPKNAELTLVSWGSSKGPILDAMDVLNKDGPKVNFLQLRVLSPFPTNEVQQVLANARRTMGIENNFSAQIVGGLVREMTGVKLDHLVVKYNGRVITMDEIVEAVQQGLAKGPERIVLRQGV